MLSTFQTPPVPLSSSSSLSCPLNSLSSPLLSSLLPVSLVRPPPCRRLASCTAGQTLRWQKRGDPKPNDRDKNECRSWDLFPALLPLGFTGCVLRFVSQAVISPNVFLLFRSGNPLDNRYPSYTKHSQGKTDLQATNMLKEASFLHSPFPLLQQTWALGVLRQIPAERLQWWKAFGSKSCWMRHILSS